MAIIPVMKAYFKSELQNGNYVGDSYILESIS